MKEEIKNLKNLSSLSKILVYLENNVIILIEVQINTESKNPKVARTKNRRIMLLSKCSSKKSKFIKQQEDSGLLGILEIKSPLSKIPLIGSLQKF